MFDIDDEKFAPPNPQSKAMVANTPKGVSGFWSAKPNQIVGINNDAVEIVVQRLPPKIGTMNE